MVCDYRYVTIRMVTPIGNMGPMQNQWGRKGYRVKINSKWQCQVGRTGNLKDIHGWKTTRTTLLGRTTSKDIGSIPISHAFNSKGMVGIRLRLITNDTNVKRHFTSQIYWNESIFFVCVSHSSTDKSMPMFQDGNKRHHTPFNLDLKQWAMLYRSKCV